MCVSISRLEKCQPKTRSVKWMSYRSLEHVQHPTAVQHTPMREINFKGLQISDSLRRIECADSHLQVAPKLKCCLLSSLQFQRCRKSTNKAKKHSIGIGCLQNTLVPPIGIPTTKRNSEYHVITSIMAGEQPAGVAHRQEWGICAI
jgi:hypothetical protein